MEAADLCLVTKDNLVCLKPKHQGRHMFRPRPHVPPVCRWEDVESLTLQTGLKRTPEKQVRVGDIVGVVGRQNAWRIVSLRKHVEDGRIEVGVVKRGTWIERVFTSDQINYRRK